MSSIDHLHSKTEMLQVEYHLNLLSALYLVHCLDIANVFYNTTILEHQLQEMKETLFTRHSHTVLPLLAITKKNTFQAIQTSFANIAINNMTDNRVLNNRPPPINDQETFLSRQ